MIADAQLSGATVEPAPNGGHHPQIVIADLPCGVLYLRAGYGNQYSPCPSASYWNQELRSPYSRRNLRPFGQNMYTSGSGSMSIQCCWKTKGPGESAFEYQAFSAHYNW